LVPRRSRPDNGGMDTSLCLQGTSILRLSLMEALPLPHLAADVVLADLPPLIPRKVLFDNPVKAGAKVSPDGKYVSYIAPDDKGVLQVWVQLLGKGDAKKVTDDKKRGIRAYFWTFQPDTLVYMQDHEGDENYHLYAVDVAKSAVKDLTASD